MALKSRSETRNTGKPSIPTASMGDIAFLIIIFFMTTSIFSREKGLKIILPEKGEEVKIKSENIMTVRVSPDGRVLIGERRPLRAARLQRAEVRGLGVLARPFTGFRAAGRKIARPLRHRRYVVIRLMLSWAPKPLPRP